MPTRDPTTDTQRYDALKRTVAEVGLLRRGSLVQRFMPCGKPNCRCQATPPQLHRAVLSVDPQGPRQDRLRRPQFSWTRIKGESDVKGGGGHGSVEEGAGSGVGADGGSPEGERSRRRRRGGWGGGLGAQAAVEREPETDVVLRLLRGESLEMVSREVGVEFYRLEAWQARRGPVSSSV